MRSLPQDFNQVVESNDLVFVDFWATWCGPCRAFGPTFEKASEANPDVYFAKVDIDQNPDLASAAKVQAVPTLMVVKNQQIVFQQAGALRASDLDDLIAQAKALDVNAAAAEEADGAGAVRLNITRIAKVPFDGETSTAPFALHACFASPALPACYICARSVSMAWR